MRKLILAAVLVGCGELPKVPTETAPAAVAEDKKPEQAAPAVEQLADMNSSFYLKTRADLWDCTEKLARQLIYVEEESTFYHCEKGDWVSVEIRGAKGDKGEKGDPGVNGDAAVTPKSSSKTDGVVTTVAQGGKDGKDGRDGKDAPYIGPDEWIDPTTGSKWYLGMSISRIDVRDFDDLCTAPGEMPTEQDVKQARKDGLYDHLRTNKDAYYWVGLDHKTFGFTAGLSIIICANSTCQSEKNIIPINYFEDPKPSTTFHRTMCVIK